MTDTTPTIRAICPECKRIRLGVMLTGKRPFKGMADELDDALAEGMIIEIVPCDQFNADVKTMGWGCQCPKLQPELL
jgi:hypothetical protein